MAPTFINVYSQTVQFIAAEQPVVFDGIRNQMGNIGHMPFTSQICIWQPGYYYVTTDLHHIEACQFAIFLNGAIYGNPFSSPTGATGLSHNLIMYISPNDIVNPCSLAPSGLAAYVETYNHTSFNPLIKLNNPGGSALNDVTCAMSMILLA
jgi:hypothetical protein